MKIVLYGGGDAFLNRELDSQMLSLINKPAHKIQLTYVPSSSFEADYYFAEFLKQY